MIGVSARVKRSRAASFAIALLEHIQAAENASLDRIPPNLRHGGAYAKAEYSVGLIIDAIVKLSDAY